VTDFPETEPEHNAPGGFSRRRLLGVAGVGAIAAVGVGAIDVARRADKDLQNPPVTKVADTSFYGEHQAGIITPAQDRLHFAAFDITTSSRAELIALLKAWTDAAVEMTEGVPVGGDETPLPYDSPPADSGEALGLPASKLTLTFGFGPTMFEKDGKDRFGLLGKKPKALRELPHFASDNLDPAKSNGDLCIQACADDPQVAVHAIRNLARIGFGTVAMRWAQLGFGRTSSTSTAQSTPRNLLGFKDGTANLKSEHGADIKEFVWVQPGAEPAADWLAHGSFLVCRRINMQIEPWDRTSLREQENLIGRDRAHGAPLSGGKEFTEPNFTIAGTNGPLIGLDAHIRLAHPDFNNGTKMLRRGYNFTDGSDALGRLDAGLFFIAYVSDPDTHYIPMQSKLSAKDGLMEYLEHTGSGIFAVPPGIAKGEYVGQSLFT
jgi:deferrochelatase/peroxidase EfeB